MTAFAAEQGVLDLDQPLPPDVRTIVEILDEIDDPLLRVRDDARLAFARTLVAGLRDHSKRIADRKRPPKDDDPRIPVDVVDLPAKRKAVYDVLHRYGQLADHELAAIYEALLEGGASGVELGYEVPAQTSSSLRFRRCELVDDLLVEDSGVRTSTPAGGTAKVWRIVTPA